MKTLIAFGVGIALGLFFKKTEKAKEPKFIIVDDRDSIDEYLFSDNAKEVFKKHFKSNRLNL